MPSGANRTAASAALVKELTPSAAKELERTVRALFPEILKDTRAQLLSSLQEAISEFCADEQLRPEKRPQVRRDLQRLAAAVDRVQRVLGKLSPETRAEAHSRALFNALARLSRGLAEPALPSDSHSNAESVRRATPDQNIYAEATDVLNRLTREIDSALNWTDSGGRPAEQHRKLLAWKVCRAMERANLTPTYTSGGKFEQLLLACIQAGATSTGNNATPLIDLRRRTRQAVEMRRRATTRRAGTKPTQK